MTTRILSKINDRFMTRMLIRGTVVGGLGVAILVVFGTLMPSSQMRIWGVPLVLVAIILIAIGMIPYRQLTKLRKQPDELTIENRQMLYMRRGAELLAIPCVSIDRIDYVERRGLYGLGIWLLHPIPQPIRVRGAEASLTYLERVSQRKFNCDLFLPFFAREECSSMQDQLVKYRAS